MDSAELYLRYLSTLILADDLHMKGIGYITVQSHEELHFALHNVNSRWRITFLPNEGQAQGVRSIL